MNSGMKFSDSISRILDFHGYRYAMNREPTGKVVLTNGCFDILHVGHVECLEYARSLGDCLIVAVNDDDGVKSLKGKSRPINPLESRMKMLKSLRCVDMVAAFPGVNASRLFSVLPINVYVKGGDYSFETLDPLERNALLKWNPEFRFFRFRTNVSTTKILEKMK